MSDWLKWLIIGGSTIIVLVIIILLMIYIRNSKYKQKEEFPRLLEAIGGTENISNLCLNGSRISFNFDSKKLVDKEQIKENGVETIVVANKKITLVIGKKAPVIYEYLQKCLNEN